MEIKFAKVSDAPIIHNLMIKAFMEYKDEVPPSSALEETAQSVLSALKNDEQALISYVDNQPVGMVRFQLKEEGLYFYRLSVVPEKQGFGIAKKILRSLEEFAIKKGVTMIFCKVRMTVPKNIKLYSSIGYEIYNEEVVHKPNGINIKVVSMIKNLK
ncbi:GNAT family N-acetyltransferase [Bacillus bingmayongensis]|uniref:GNAT family N-acetyltransferase n=1 Tax=Bacillus bingmayongensis TaxID=1150157 RepID=UPI001C8DCAB6|nr:GNAT family N-acetyltransferase [Bacillus bingmayongensis]MBY0599934.1 GNAT family N-acetyltransferase [Bacillus bingmayongensis]